MSITCRSILRAPTLLAHIDKLYYNKDAPRELIAASQEAWGTGLLMSAGSLFGLAGRAIVMLATRTRFSIPSMLFFGLLGLEVGTLVSTPLMYSYLVNFSKREDILIEYQEKKQAEQERFAQVSDNQGMMVRETLIDAPERID